MQIVLYEPEIPPNTGNVARLCAATSTPLHLVEPLGFSLDDRYLKRAGLDYWPHVDLTVWPGWDDFLAGYGGGRLIMTSARGGAPHHAFRFEAGDWLVFGPETRGLPGDVVGDRPCVRIPIWGQVRSLNLSTATGVVLYEAYRQTGGLERGT